MKSSICNRFWITAATAALWLTSCGSADPVVEVSNASAPPQPHGMDITFQWIPSAEFDPMSSEGTFVRAFVESHELARDGLGMEWGYPGFEAASPPELNSQLTMDSPFGPFTGTLIYRLLSRHDTDVATQVTLCRYGSYTRFEPWNDGPDRLVSRAWNPNPIILEFNKDGTPPPTGQRGPNRAPTTNKFGQWKATGWDFVPKLPHGGDTPQYAECESNSAGLPPLPTQRTNVDTHMKPLPPAPGWPGTGL